MMKLEEKKTLRNQMRFFFVERCQALCCSDVKNINIGP